MSLRTRVFLLTLAVTGSIVAVLFAVQLTNVVDSWLRGSEEIAKVAGQQVKHFIISRVEGHAGERDSWGAMLRTDKGLTTVLEMTMAETRSILEISVADRFGGVFASSNPDRVGGNMADVPPLESLRRSGPLGRVLPALKFSRDYQVAIPLGVNGESRPVFTIQVIVSSVLLREELLPETKRVVEWGLAALLTSIALAWLSARLAVGDMRRVSVVLDRISSGNDPTAAAPPATEFAAIQTKLDLLGHRFRSASELRDNVHALLEGLQEAILLCDGDGRVLLCGGPVERVLGIGPEMLTGKLIGEAFHENARLYSTAVKAFALHLPAKEIVDGRLFSVEFTADQVSPDRVTGMVRIRDVAADRELHSHLDVSARMDAMNRITSSVAHEIKNPLNAIAVRLDNLQAMAPGDPEAEEEIECIAQEVSRLDRVVRAFLDFTRPVELAQEPINIAALVQEVAELLEPDARRSGISVEYRSEAQPVWVRGDEDLLKDAVINIAANGIEAMSPGGCLQMSVANGGGQCLVTISDTGAGIPPEQRDKIFNLYFTTKKNGSGLGLAMAFRAAQLHHGGLEFDSEPGRGASFRMHLPIMVVGDRPAYK